MCLLCLKNNLSRYNNYIKYNISRDVIKICIKYVFAGQDISFEVFETFCLKYLRKYVGSCHWLHFQAYLQNFLSNNFIPKCHVKPNKLFVIKPNCLADILKERKKLF